MKIENSYSESGPGEGRSLPYQIVLSAENTSDAVSLSQFLTLIDVVGWEWVLCAMAQRCEGKLLANGRRSR